MPAKQQTVSASPIALIVESGMSRHLTATAPGFFIARVASGGDDLSTIS